MKRSALFVCASLAASALVSSPAVGRETLSAAPAKQTVVATGKDCRETEAFLLIDLETLDEHVPDPYVVGEIDAGLGELLITITTCRNFSVDGKSGSGEFLGKAGIYIEPPKGSMGGFDYYGLWYATGRKDLANRLTKFGVNVPVMEDALMKWLLGDGRNESFINMHSHTAKGHRDESVSMDVINPVPASLFIGYDSTFWFESRKGTVTIQHQAEPRYWSGAMRYATADGSTVADIVGETEGLAENGTLALFPELSLVATRR